ncbi:hypothetical protein HDU88_007397 [Geranomyces variabilis]|nr:hypothetical protein HDU88_007397 [Geranomyces variabilis]
MSTAEALPLYGVVAAPSGGYRVFTVRLAGLDVPLAHVRLQIASRLGIDPNSPSADILDVYRVDEALHEDDERLRVNYVHDDPAAIFALTRLPETMNPVSQWIPNLANSSLHVLVRLPGGIDSDYAMPPAYGDETPAPSDVALADGKVLAPSAIAESSSRFGDDGTPNYPQPEVHVDAVRTSLPTSAQQALPEIIHSEIGELNSRPTTYEDFMNRVSVTASGPANTEHHKYSPVAPLTISHKIGNGEQTLDAVTHTTAAPFYLRRKWLVVGLLFVLVIIATVVGVVVATKKRQSASSDSILAPPDATPSASPTPSAPGGTPSENPTSTAPSNPDIPHAGARAYYTAPGCQGKPSSWYLALYLTLPCFADGSQDVCINTIDGGSARSTCVPGTSWSDVLFYGESLYSVIWPAQSNNCSQVTASGLPAGNLVGCRPYSGPVSTGLKWAANGLRTVTTVGGAENSTWQFNPSSRELSVYKNNTQCNSTSPRVVTTTCRLLEAGYMRYEILEPKSATFPSHW